MSSYVPQTSQLSLKLMVISLWLVLRIGGATGLDGRWLYRQRSDPDGQLAAGVDLKVVPK
jgi:hypothetical protein